MNIFLAVGRFIKTFLIVVIWLLLVVFVSGHLLEDYLYSIRGETVSVVVTDKYTKDWGAPGYGPGVQYYFLLKCRQEPCPFDNFEQNVGHETYKSIQIGTAFNAEYIPGKKESARLFQPKATSWVFWAFLVLLIFLPLLSYLTKRK